MAVERCYYEVLGVERTADGEEIKRSYRRLAMKFHPDRNPGDPKAEATFKECAEAYEVLGDAERRQRYDQHGRAGLRGTPGHDFRNMHAEDIFSMFADIFGAGGAGFGGAGGRGGRGSRGRGGVPQGYHLETEVSIALEDCLTGTEQDVPFRRLDVCKPCTGSGAKPGTKPDKCATCGGQGQVMQSGLGGMFRMVTTCPTCSGRGTVIKERCESCKGAGRVPQKRTISVKIPAGISDGQVIRIAGEGEPPPPEQSPTGQGKHGDLHVVVRVAEHEHFAREGDDLITTRAIHYPQAALGARVPLSSLDGDIELDIPPGTEHGTLLRVRGRGIPNLRSGTRGDLIIGIRIEVSRKHTDRERELLKELSEIQGDPIGDGKGKGVWQKIKESIGG